MEYFGDIINYTSPQEVNTRAVDKRPRDDNVMVYQLKSGVFIFAFCVTPYASDKYNKNISYGPLIALFSDYLTSTCFLSLLGG